MRFFWYLSIGVLSACTACAQTVVEHAIITGGASGAAAGAKGAGKSVGGVFGSLSGTLDKAGTASATSAAAAPPAQAPAAQPKESAKPAPPRLVDPSQVTVGMSRAELIKLFGEPVMRLSERSNAQLVERFWYNTTATDPLEVRLMGGKVASIRPPVSAP
jgi:hypothetical protein